MDPWITQRRKSIGLFPGEWRRRLEAHDPPAPFSCLGGKHCSAPALFAQGPPCLFAPFAGAGIQPSPTNTGVQLMLAYNQRLERVMDTKAPRESASGAGLPSLLTANKSFSTSRRGSAAGSSPGQQDGISTPNSGQSRRGSLNQRGSIESTEGVRTLAQELSRSRKSNKSLEAAQGPSGSGSLARTSTSNPIGRRSSTGVHWAEAAGRPSDTGSVGPDPGGRQAAAANLASVALPRADSSAPSDAGAASTACRGRALPRPSGPSPLALRESPCSRPTWAAPHCHVGATGPVSFPSACRVLDARLPRTSNSSGAATAWKSQGLAGENGGLGERRVSQGAQQLSRLSRPSAGVALDSSNQYQARTPEPGGRTMGGRTPEPPGRPRPSLGSPAPPRQPSARAALAAEKKEKAGLLSKMRRLFKGGSK